MARTPIEDLVLQGNKGHLNRALQRPPLKRCAKRKELEALWQDLTERRDEALADLRENGTFIMQDRFNNGRLYQAKVVNPALKIAQATEKQLVQVARLLTEEVEGTGRKSAKDLLEEADRLLGSAN